MATAAIAFNPYLTTNASGSFNIQSDGYVQGTLLDNPVELFKIAGGIVDAGETVPMWGGIAITEKIPNLATGQPNDALGGAVARATLVANVTGFTVFNQAQHMITTPQSPVPQSGSGNSVHLARLGSGVRLAVACDPSLASLEGGAINPNVSWDFNNQVLQPYVASGPTEAVTSMTWSSTNGGQVAVVMTGASVFKLGDVINVSGVTNSGTGALSLINTNHVINTWTDTTHFTFLLPGTSSIWGTLGGTIVLNVGIGALPVQVIGFNFGNSMTVVYDPVTGFVTWNRSGSCAVIIL